MSKPTKEDTARIKGAIRRAFTLSDLHKSVRERSIVQHTDPNRPRVKTWYVCADCKNCEAAFKMQVDHVFPVAPLDKVLAEMDWNDFVERIWCNSTDLQLLCKECHHLKTQAENAQRRMLCPRKLPKRSNKP